MSDDWALPEPHQSLMTFDDIWMPLPRGERVSTNVERDDVTELAILPFDYSWTGTTTFDRHGVPPELPDDWGVGVIVGASGSGKSTMLRSFGHEASVSWEAGRTIASHFDTADDATSRFAAVGLNSVPTWTKPYDVLSTGEKFRADLARRIDGGAVIDEFTSVVDRNVAMSASNALRRWVDATSARRIVIATCHRDVLPWLQPDWIIDLDIKSWALYPRGCLQRPDLVVAIYAATRDAWSVFAPHHYLNANVNDTARCYVATLNDTLMGFTAVMSFPGGGLRDAFREHRTVVLPDFQGLGLGVRLSDFIAEMYVSNGKRYYSRTSHPRMGSYREASPVWRATSSSGKLHHTIADRGSDRDKLRRERTHWGQWDFDGTRIAWSHEYVGSDPRVHERIARETPLNLGLEVPI